MQHFWHIMLYYFKKGYVSKKHNWNAEKTCAVYGGGAMTDQRVKSVLAKFRAGDFSQTMVHGQ